MPEEAAPPAPAELPLLEFELAVEGAADRLRPAHLRNAARNAFVHLRRAWQLRSIDPEMAIFRAITAQEEAATALILGLKQQAYPGADQLRQRDHRHKVAVLASFHAARDSLAAHKFPEIQVNVKKVGEPAIDLRFDLQKLADLPKPLWAQLEDPFELVMRSGPRGGQVGVHPFENELAKLADAVGAEDIEAHIQKMANRRNQLLYAGQNGLPAAECTEEYLLQRARLVTAMTVVLIGIMQTPKRQSFIVQCLEGLLKALGRAEGVDFIYPEDQPTFPTFEMHARPDGKIKLKVRGVPYETVMGRWRYWDCAWWPRLAGVKFHRDDDEVSLRLA